MTHRRNRRIASAIYSKLSMLLRPASAKALSALPSTYGRALLIIQLIPPMSSFLFVAVSLISIPAVCGIMFAYGKTAHHRLKVMGLGNGNVNENSAVGASEARLDMRLSSVHVFYSLYPRTPHYFPFRLASADYGLMEHVGSLSSSACGGK